jgi:hypothetical protein
MTLPSSGPISINDINTEFALGNNLNAYRGALYATPSGTAGVFSAGTISMSAFYSTQKVTAQTTTNLPGGTFTVPPYRTITFTATGGGGGQTGANGVYSGGPLNGVPTGGSSGASGGNTTVGGYVTGAGGGPSAGGSTSSVTLTNPVLGGAGPVSGSTLSVSIGGGGGGGQGGAIFVWNGSTYIASGFAATGASGAAGSATVAWTA